MTTAAKPFHRAHIHMSPELVRAIDSWRGRQPGVFDWRSSTLRWLAVVCSLGASLCENA
jgi:hypothetical protein